MRADVRGQEQIKTGANRKMGITAKELAKKMGLSQAAGSMALNGKPGVSTETRMQVMEAAEKYGYDFTRISKKAQDTGSICFALYRKHGAIVADTPFFSELSEGIRTKCREEGYKLRIVYLYGDETLTKQIEDIQYSDCVGLILLGTEMLPEDFAPFDCLPLPVVLLDVYFDHIKRDCVLINNVQGAYQATDYLITRTRKQPGYLRSAYRISNFEERADGFYKAVRAHGMSASKSVTHSLTPSIDGAFADMLEIIEKKEELAPCYFADNDLIAIGAMKALQRSGCRIPEDIALIGFDNLPMSSYIEPGLCTVNVPKQYMGEMAAARLIELLHARQFVPVKLEVGTNLVKRRSL